jgi:LysR family hydrogen peroxide-inducible transcriptional activator
MELDQLRYFVMVGRWLNVTKAAEELGISQSALSRSIQKLEEELGQTLLERKTRAVALTDAGEFLWARAQEILRLAEDTRAEMTEQKLTGRVRVGAIPTVAPYLLPEILRRFAIAYPQASVIVQEQTTERLLKSCTESELDLAILSTPWPVKYLEVEPLFDEDLWLCLPTDHALVAQGTIRLKDVEPYPFVLLDEAHCLSGQVLSFCRRRSQDPVVVERTSQLTMVQELVALGHGISFIPEMARQRDQTDRRVYRRFTGTTPRRTVAMAWNPYRFQTRLVLAFQAVVRQLRDSPPASTPPGGSL